MLHKFNAIQGEISMVILGNMSFRTWNQKQKIYQNSQQYLENNWVGIAML